MQIFSTAGDFGHWVLIMEHVPVVFRLLKNINCEEELNVVVGIFSVKLSELSKFTEL